MAIICLKIVSCALVIHAVPAFATTANPLGTFTAAEDMCLPAMRSACSPSLGQSLACGICASRHQYQLKSARCTADDITRICRTGRLKLSTTAEAALQPLFDPPHRRQSWTTPANPTPRSTVEFQWLGGDCASSLRLSSRGPNATLWLFGDTLLGTMGPEKLRQQRGCFMPHQVLVLPRARACSLLYAFFSNGTVTAVQFLMHRTELRIAKRPRSVALHLEN